MSACRGYFKNLLLSQHLQSKISCSDSCSHDRFSDYIYILWIREPSPSLLSPKRTSCSWGMAVFHPGYGHGAIRNSDEACVSSCQVLVVQPNDWTSVAEMMPHIKKQRWDVLMSNRFRIFLTSSSSSCRLSVTFSAVLMFSTLGKSFICFENAEK